MTRRGNNQISDNFSDQKSAQDKEELHSPETAEVADQLDGFGLRNSLNDKENSVGGQDQQNGGRPEDIEAIVTVHR